MTLRRQLLAVLLLVALLPVAVMGALVAWHFDQETSRVISITRREEGSTARLSADIVSQSLQGALGGLDLVRRRLSRHPLSSDDLQSLVGVIADLEALSVTDASGRVIASSGPIESARRLSWLSIPTLRDSGGPVYSPIHRSLANGTPVMSFALAYRRHDHFAGAVAGALDLDALRANLDRRKALASSERLELADSRGHSFELVAPQREFSPDAPTLQYSEAIAGTPWKVSVVRSLAIELAAPWQSAMRSAGVVLISLIFAVTIGLMASRRLGGAFADLAAEVGGFSPTDPRTLPVAHPTPWTSKEYEALRSAFRALALELAGKFQALEDSRRELEGNVAELQRLDVLKRDFLANVSHELRTPLNHILAYSSSLEEGVFGDLAPEQRNAISVVLRAAGHLLDEIEQLLLISQLEAGGPSVHKDEIQLAESLEEVHLETEKRCQAKEIVLHWDLPSWLVLIDVSKVIRVMTVLVDNAIKFTPAGGRVEVTASRQNGDLRLEVSDSGVGIPPSALGHVFESFYQADGSSTRRFGGLGVGLHLAWRLVGVMDGRIAVEPGESGGTRATVWLFKSVLE